MPIAIEPIEYIKINKPQATKDKIQSTFKNCGLSGNGARSFAN
jgi:hypothetical protein